MLASNTGKHLRVEMFGDRVYMIEIQRLSKIKMTRIPPSIATSGPLVCTFKFVQIINVFCQSTQQSPSAELGGGVERICRLQRWTYRRRNGRVGSARGVEDGGNRSKKPRDASERNSKRSEGRSQKISPGRAPDEPGRQSGCVMRPRERPIMSQRP